MFKFIIKNQSCANVLRLKNWLILGRLSPTWGPALSQALDSLQRQLKILVRRKIVCKKAFVAILQKVLFFSHDPISFFSFLVQKRALTIFWMTFFEDIELLLRPWRCNCFGLLWLLKKSPKRSCSGRDQNSGPAEQKIKNALAQKCLKMSFDWKKPSLKLLRLWSRRC